MRILTRLVLILGVLACASVASAQSLSLAWTQEGPDLVTISAYTYSTSTNSGPLVKVTPVCTGNASPFTCLVPFNQSTYAPGVKQSITVTSCDGLICAAPSNSVAFTVPQPARNTRLQ